MLKKNSSATFGHFHFYFVLYTHCFKSPILVQKIYFYTADFEIQPTLNRNEVKLKSVDYEFKLNEYEANTLLKKSLYLIAIVVTEAS